jgi:type IV secretory pathway VirJ component
MILLRRLLFSGLLFLSVAATAQNRVTSLPTLVKAPATSTTAPLILYITGDGGMKKFSANMITAFNQKNYPVVALNALKYFWNKKTPQQAAKDVSDLISYYQNQWNTHNGVILVGYSLGADVLSFVYMNLPPATAAEIKQLVFLSPSAYTDLEVHVSDMLGRTNNKGYSVLAEINKISDKPLLLVFGDEEKDLNLSAIKVPYKQLILPGGHNYDEDANGVAGKILAALQH